MPAIDLLKIPIPQLERCGNAIQIVLGVWFSPGFGG
jgi:hypothetical protein